MIDANKIVYEYDIRGLYPQELTPELYRQIGQAVAQKYSPKHVAVGYDVRESSPQLAQELIQGLINSGVNVYELGLISTEIINFVSGFYPNIDLAMVVTASHNPKEYNGLKVVGKNAEPISRSTGLLDLVNLALTLGESSSTPGQLLKLDNFWAEYSDFINNKTGINSLKKEFHLVIDPGNGVGGYAFDKLFGQISNIKPHLVHAFPNGEFPFHEANPAHFETLQDLISLVKESKDPHDLGVAFDADADRLVFIDSEGELVHPYYLGIILGEHFLRTTDKNIIHDSRLRLGFNDLAKKYPGRVIVNKPGRSNFYANIKNKNAVFAVEASGHFFYSDFYNADSASLTFAHMLKLLEDGRDLKTIRQEVAGAYFIAGEVNYVVEDPDAQIKIVKDYFAEKSDLSLSEIDGLEVTADTWAMSIRKSNTQALIRLNIEGRSEQTVREKFKEITNLINGKRENEPIMPGLV